jgi:hypothetical protein
VCQARAIREKEIDPLDKARPRLSFSVVCTVKEKEKHLKLKKFMCPVSNFERLLNWMLNFENLAY